MGSQVAHSSRKHALLSASGASRWLNCTPSARLEEKFDESSPSVYAEEGTLAHEFGDINLRFFNKEISEKVYSSELKKLRKHKLYTDEMEEQVSKYTDYVIESLNVARQKTKDAILLVEKRLDFSHLVEKGFGTGDSTIIADGIMEILDLKYGKGVKVDAENNPQLMLYGSGALRTFEMLYDIHTVKLTIIQPRLDHISSWEISVKDLIDWGEKTVKPTALKAYSGKGVQKAGSWCKRCKVSPMCATLAAQNIKLAQHEFRDPHKLTPKQLIDVYKQMPMLVDWVNSVQSYLLKEALKGKKLPGYKVVEGRSNRKWLDEEKVIEILENQYLGRSDFMQSKLQGIAKIEKLLGAKNFKELVSNYVIKPQGKPTLVPESDKRKPIIGIENAKEDFK